MIAALYVQRGGCYYGIEDVDPWDEARDARLYAGPWPVVAHPPCARWGKFWFGSPQFSPQQRKRKGDDGGCFASALAAVRRFGGVLEHPAGSAAWPHFGIGAPPAQGWAMADFDGGWTCQVEQGHYGHRCRKPTWLYAVAVALPPLRWGASRVPPLVARNPKTHGTSMRRTPYDMLSHKERAATPLAFRDVLLDIARSARREGVDR